MGSVVAGAGLETVGGVMEKGHIGHLVEENLREHCTVELKKGMNYTRRKTLSWSEDVRIVVVKYRPEGIFAVECVKHKLCWTGATARSVNHYNMSTHFGHSRFAQLDVSGNGLKT